MAYSKKFIVTSFSVILTYSLIVQFYEITYIDWKSKLKKKTEMMKIEDIDISCRPLHLIGFPNCLNKFQWMRNKWTSNKCYKRRKVNGSDCSILRYLSTIEGWCPVPENKNYWLEDLYHNSKDEKIVLRENLDKLLTTLKEMKPMKWIYNRILRMQKKWKLGKDALFKRWKDLETSQKYTKKKILIVIGVLFDKQGMKFAENAFKGGPLGELVQWSDLLASLHVLGHEITICVSSVDMKKLLSIYNKKNLNCNPEYQPFHIIFSDILGLRKIFKGLISSHLLKCHLRVIDSFGTEPQFNNNRYSKMKGQASVWGGLELYTKQFYTMFPHTPDNTFLGFVIEDHQDSDNLTINTASNVGATRDNLSLIYGKADKFWKDKKKYIDVINEFTEVHGTVDASEPLENVPNYVTNHGVLPGNQLQSLLRQAKIFVGLGFPYEGPAPLEAIANGMIFLNPKIKSNTQLSLDAKAFFKDKPTSRLPKTQNDYASNFIGPPYVRDVDIDDLDAVRKEMKEIIDSPQLKPFLLHEFSCFGMLERLSIFIEKQNFCTFSSSWPPISSLQPSIIGISSRKLI